MTHREFFHCLVELGFLHGTDDGHPNGPDYKLTIAGYAAVRMLNRALEREEFTPELMAALAKVKP